MNVAVGSLLAGLALSVGLGGCGSGGGSATGAKRPPPQVVVQKPEQRDLPVEVRAPVDLRPIVTVDVTSKQLGYLSAVLVDRGDRVRRGQPLSLVRPSDLPDQLQAARGTLAQAQAALQQARTNRERTGALSPSGVVSMQELEQSRTQLLQAESAESAAQAQLSAVATRLGESRIDSPLDGVVLSRRLDAGALVGPTTGQVILTVARLDVLKVIVAVREREAARLAIDQEALVEVDARPGEHFNGRVVRLSPGFDPLTRTLDAEVHLANDKGLLRPGMYGRAALRVGLHPRAIVVPEAAVLLSGRDRFVYTVREGRAQRKPVTVGIDGGTWLEIEKGLAPEDEVVVAGAEIIADGLAVTASRGTNVYTGSSK